MRIINAINKEPEQLLLFSQDDFAGTETPAKVSITLPVVIPAPVKKPAEDPEFTTLRNNITFLAGRNNLRGLVALLKRNYDGIDFNYRISTFFFNESTLQKINYGGWRPDHRQENHLKLRDDMKYSENAVCSFTMNYIHVSPDLNVKVIPIDVTMRNQYVQGNDWYYVTEIKVGKTLECKKAYPQAVFVQGEDLLRHLVLQDRPYLQEFLATHPVTTYLLMPWLETLCKAGYNFAEILAAKDPYEIDRKCFEILNRLTVPGTKPKTIFKVPKRVYECLKADTNLSLWDIYRKMSKTGKIGQDSIRQAYDSHLDERGLEKVNAILSKEYNNKKVFSWDTLIRYLGRLDMYEAISQKEALQLLDDYLSMCSQLNMEPRIDGDSLKREHDITARLMRERRNQIQAEAMKKKEEELQKQIAEGKTKLGRCNYSEGVYFVRLITDYNDLLDEARQQHNCVASYADKITKETSIICTMRHTSSPERSLVTIELSPDCRTIRQKLLAYNQPIRNKSMTDFIERWHKQLNK